MYDNNEGNVRNLAWVNDCGRCLRSADCIKQPIEVTVGDSECFGDSNYGCELGAEVMKRIWVF